MVERFQKNSLLTVRVFLFPLQMVRMVLHAPAAVCCDVRGLFAKRLSGAGSYFTLGTGKNSTQQS